MMPLWHLKGGQNPSFETYRTTPDHFMQEVEAFVESGPKEGEEKSLPVIAPDPAQDISMLGRL
jgi:cytochrome c oxidase subunit 2